MMINIEITIMIRMKTSMYQPVHHRESQRTCQPPSLQAIPMSRLPSACRSWTALSWICKWILKITHKNGDKKLGTSPTTSTWKKTISEHLQNGRFIFANKVNDSHSCYGRLRELSLVFHIGLKCDSSLWWLTIEFVRGCANIDVCYIKVSFKKVKKQGCFIMRMMIREGVK